MSLRDPYHQSAIELGELDTEYRTSLKDERTKLRQELESVPGWKYWTIGAIRRRAAIRARLARIEELLAK